MTLDVILVGAGNRGFNPFGQYALDHPNELKYVAVVEPNSERRALFAKQHNIPEDKCFTFIETMPKEKLAKAAINATNDRNHFRTTIQLLERGYEVLLEKPMATTLKDCQDIVEAVKKYNSKLMVMHILRYAPLYEKVKGLIDSGEIGKIQKIEHIEHIGDWHFPHSYVRGNWNNKERSGPISLTKTCHDFDIIYWILNSKCESLNSVSKPLKFTFEKMQDVPNYCLDGCRLEKECQYFAPKAYENARHWLKTAVHISGEKEKILEALKKGKYGRCVYRCDNNVPDYQKTRMVFENGVVVDFIMESEHQDFTRNTLIIGEKGKIEADLARGKLDVTKGNEKQSYSIEAVGGHGGGDSELIKDFIRLMNGETTEKKTSAENSLYSHMLAFMAEESRINDGRVLYV